MTDEKFTHLHNHSFYSLLDGLSSVKDMVQGAVDLGFKSLSINDHGTCAGLLNFQKECKSKNIKPILGMEAYITEDHNKQDDTSKTYHLNLIAKNKAGYKNLIYLSSFGYLKGFYRKPRIDFDILEKHSEGLIVSTACCIGEIPYLLWKNDKEKAKQLAEKYKEVFKDDFYIEIMTHEYYNDKEQEERENKLAVMLHDLAKEINVKAICTTDFHYVRKEDWEAQDVLLSIQTIDNIKNPDRFTFNSKDFYMKPYEEMVRLYSYDMSLLKNTVEISEKVENDLITFNQDLLPSFKVPEGFKDEEAYLKELVKSGMKEKGLIDITAYRDRIKYEMSVIIKCKYTKYFLVLWDIINFARINKIYVGLGRGSAVSSLVLYVLGVTKVDPLKYDLIFERFLNPDRISPPDVDVDFDYNRREEVYNYIVSKYGSEYCSQIGTYNKLKARAVIGRVAKALDIGNDWEETQKSKINKSNDAKDKKEEISKKSLELAGIIAKQIPFDPQITIEKALKDNEKFRQSMHKYPKLLDCARHIEGTMSSAGVHPAGIIVCKDKVIDHIPLRLSKGVICSQYDGPEVESIGLLKFDLLALKTLTVIDKTVKMIKERHKLDLDIDNLIPNDKKVFSVFDKSDDKNKIDTKGIFQFESPGMTKLLEAIKVDTVEDLIVANALYRPGPLGAGMHNMYAEYKHRKREITYLHPKMGEVLKDTYGIFCYQENLMKVCQVLAGFTGAQSDTFRKVVGKKKPELIKKERLDELFVEGCVKNGISKDVATKIFDQMFYFAGYGFNKSHSASYALIAYQSAYLKYYYSLEFMCNLLSSETNNNDKDEKLNEYMRNCEKMGIRIFKPNIDYSGSEFRIDKVDGEEVIRCPLTILKGVGLKAVDNIVKNQPYKSLEDFLRKIDHRVVNVRVFKTLAENGCMTTVWKITPEKLIKQYEEIKKQIDKDDKIKKKREKEDKNYDGSLFDDCDNIVV